MIRIHGVDGPGKRLLQQMLEGVEFNEDVCWGIEGPEEWINHQRRLDAVEQLEVFYENGISAPEFTEDVREAREWVDEQNLVFGRRRLHTHGNDIVGPRHKRWAKSEYYVKVIPNVLQEWRIHVFQGRSIARGVKVQVEAPWRKLPVRNRGNGWRMTHEVEPPKGLRTLAKKAVEAVGYDFGAVDLLVQENGKQWVLEVNKAPGLDEYTAGKYALAIMEGI